MVNAPDNEESQFLNRDKIPYACYLNRNTIITKNGNLIQIVKFQSYYSDINIRDRLIKLIKEKKIHNFSFWTHLIRYKKPLKGHNKHYFGKMLFNSYQKTNNLEHYHTNDLYISIVSQHKAFNNIINLFQKAFSAKLIYNEYKSFFDQYVKNINQVRENILEACKEYNPTTIEIDDSHHSRLLATLKRIILIKKAKPLTVQIKDISDNISKTCKTSFRFNYIKNIHNDTSSFISILNVKSFQNPSSYRHIDTNIISIDQPMMITEILIPKANKEIQKYFKEQISVLSFLNNNSNNNILGFEQIIHDLQNKNQHFFSHNLHISITAPSLNELNDSVNKISEQLRSCGLHIVRNDIKTENVFFSLLPGNFKYIQDPKINHIDNVFSFCSLHNYPTGSLINKFGQKPLTTFRNSDGKPYFFNWQYTEKFRHSVFIGNNKYESNTVKNFLLSESITSDVSVIIIENTNFSELFIQAIAEGQYYNCDKQEVRIDIFEEKYIQNHDYLEEIVKRLSRFKLKDEPLAEIVQEISQLENKNHENIIEILMKNEIIMKNMQNHPQLLEQLKTTNHSIVEDKVTGIKLPTLSDENIIFKSILIYYAIITRIINKNTKHSIISIESIEMFRYFTSQQIENLLTLAQENECMIIFLFSDNFLKINSSYVSKIIDSTESIFVFPDHRISSKTVKSLGLSKKEDFNLIMDLDSLDHCFFLSQKSLEGSSIIRMNHSRIKESLILTAHKKTTTIREAITETAPKKWIPQFLHEVEGKKHKKHTEV